MTTTSSIAEKKRTTAYLAFLVGMSVLTMRDVRLFGQCGEAARDFCSLARVLSGAPGTQEVVMGVAGATPDIAPNCGVNAGHGVWFVITPSISGLLTFSTCDPSTSYDTIVQAYTGDCEFLSPLQCVDDSPGANCDNGCSGSGSIVELNVTAGTTYRFQVSSFNQNSGGCGLCLGVLVTLGAQCGENPSDFCQIPRVLPGSIGNHFVEMDATYATSDVNMTCVSNVGHTVWFQTTPQVDGPVTFTTCTPETTFDTVVQVWESDGTGCGTLQNVACVDDTATAACDNGCDHQSSEVTFDGIAGQTYLFQVGAYNGNIAQCDLCLGAKLTIAQCANDTDCADGNDCTRDICFQGECSNPPSTAGTACGDPTNTPCNQPDTCNGAGICLPNYAASGTPCPDGVFCNGVEACDGSGACAPGIPPCPSSLICDDKLDQCVTDCNGNAIPDPFEPFSGLEFTQQISASMATYVDSSAPDSNYTGDDVVFQPFLAVGRQAGPRFFIETEAWIGFDLTIPAGVSIEQATLEVGVVSGTGFGSNASIDSYAVGGAWSADTLTWSNRPALGSASDSRNVPLGTNFVSWDVTEIVQEALATGEMSMGVALVAQSGSTGWSRFLRGVAGGAPPELTITYRMSPCASIFASTVELSGVSPPSNPISGIPVQLFRSSAPGVLGTMIDEAVSGGDGTALLFDSPAGPAPRYYTLRTSDSRYSVTSASSGSGGTATPNGELVFSDASPDTYGNNVFQLTPAFVPNLETREFLGEVRDSNGTPVPQVEVVLYGADVPDVSDAVLAGTSTADDGTFRLTIEADPDDAFPTYVLQVADVDYEVLSAFTPTGNVTGDNRIVNTAVPAGVYDSNIFGVQRIGAPLASADASGFAQLRPVVVVVLNTQCMCNDPDCDDCDPNTKCDCSGGCKTITNPNVLSRFGQTIFDPIGESINNFFQEMSQGRYGLKQAGLYQVVPMDDPSTPGNESQDQPGLFSKPEYHRAYLTRTVLGQQLQFPFANYDVDHSGTVEEDELIVLIAGNDPNTNNARTRSSEPQSVRVGNVNVRVFYSLVQTGNDFYTIAHELTHAWLWKDQYWIPTDLYGGEGNAGTYSLMDNHCPFRVCPSDPNVPLTAAQRIGNQHRPHLDPWNKIKLGWITPTVINTDQWLWVDAVENAGEVYKIMVPGHDTKEYYLLENRWASGSDYDTQLPDSGLAIWHINENYFPEARKIVALERAGGGVNSGATTNYCNDDNDTTAMWSGENNFHPNSHPNSDWSDGSDSGVAVLCMTAAADSVHTFVSVNWTDDLPDPDSFEPNDSESAATVVALPLHQTHSLHAPCDVDFFELTTVDYVDVTVTTTGYADPFLEQSAAAPNVTLRRDGQPVLTQQGGFTRIHHKPGTVYFEVDSPTTRYYTIDVLATTSTIAPDEFDDQLPPGEPRNDLFSDAANISNRAGSGGRLFVADLNHDIPNDIDFFRVDFTPPGASEDQCCPNTSSNVEAGHMQIRLLPDAIRPFNIDVYKSDGTVQSQAVGLTQTIQCPQDAFTDGSFVFSVQDRAARNFYDLEVSYAPCRIYPNWFLQYDPPPFNWQVPSLLFHLPMVFPLDPSVIFGFDAGKLAAPFPAEYLLFDRADTGLYRLDIELQNACTGPCLNVSLIDETGQQVAIAQKVGASSDKASDQPASQTLRLAVPDLQEGLYFLKIDGGAFGTVYSLNTPVTGDLNDDQSVDLRDAAAFQECFTGENGSTPSGPCLDADLNLDSAVDLSDAQPFIDVLTGPR